MIYRIEPEVVNSFSNRYKVKVLLDKTDIPFKFLYSEYGDCITIEVSEADAVVLSLRRVGVEVGA